MKFKFRTRPLLFSFCALAGTIACSTSPGGTQSTGGATKKGGVANTGGSASTGGVTNSGGTTHSGGAASTGGSTSSGGSASTGGTLSTGGETKTGGTTGLGGTTSAGGTSSTGGTTRVGSDASAGGTTGFGGATNSGGTASTGGNTGGAASAGGTTGEIVNGCPVKLEGWAEFAGTTGGGNAPVQKVTSVAELLTLGKDDVPRVIELEGTYNFGSEYFRVGSNKTFIGKGKNTVLKAAKAVVSLRKSHNVILRNFTVIGGGVSAGTEGGDSVTATEADRLWFDHLAVLDGPDGILDLTQGSTHATISWCKFWYTEANHPHRLALLFSSGSDPGVGATDRGKMEHTIHHTWFAELIRERMPRLLWGKGHMYNNFYNSPDNLYCIGGGSWASLLVENNYFKDVHDPHRFQDMCPTFIAASGNIYDNTIGKQDTGLFAGDFPKCITGGDGAVLPGPWTPPYKYSLDDAKGIPELVKRCAGPQ